MEGKKSISRRAVVALSVNLMHIERKSLKHCREIGANPSSLTQVTVVAGKAWRHLMSQLLLGTGYV